MTVDAAVSSSAVAHVSRQAGPTVRKLEWETRSADVLTADRQMRGPGAKNSFARVPEALTQIFPREVAGRFQAARNNQTNPTVRAAYDQLARQSDVIFARLTDPDRRFLRGLRVAFTRCESPYDSDEELVRSARTHRVLEITTSARSATAVTRCWDATPAARTTGFGPCTTSLDMWAHVSASTEMGNSRPG